MKLRSFLCINNFHRKHFSLTLYHGSLKRMADRVHINGSRHDGDFQVVSDNLLGLMGEGKSKISRKTSFMKFIKDNKIHPVECSIFYQHSGKNSFRHDFNACIFRNFGFKANTIAHSFSYRFSEQVSHALSDLSGCNSPGFENDYFPLASQCLKHGKRENG